MTAEQCTVAANVPDNRTAYEKKVGKLNPEIRTSFDPFIVRNSLQGPDAQKAYDKYIKDHASRLRQLERLARGEMAPSSRSYGR